VRWPHYSPARRIRLGSAALGVVEMAKYLVLSSFTGQPVKRFAAKPPDQAAVVRSLAESAGGRPERCYRMSGQDDEMGVFGQPGSHTRAAVSLAATSSGAFTPLRDARTDRGQ
jgi:uncharacterized protein with GYD domain